MSTCCIYEMERETTDFVPLLVEDRVTGLPVTDYKTAVVKGRNRPTVWTNAVVTTGGQTGVVLSNLTPGTWHVFVRAVFPPFEDIVTEAGQVNVD